MIKKLLLVLALVGVYQANCIPGANGAGLPPSYLSNPYFPTCKPFCLVNNGTYVSLDMDCLNDCMYWANQFQLDVAANLN